MDINRSNMTEFFEELKASFTAGFDANFENSLHNKLAMTIDSKSASMTHGWLEQFGEMREWVGDRIVENITSDKLTITNKLYEKTKDIRRVDIEDDQHGLYLPIVSGMGAVAARQPEIICMHALLRGTADTWADGEVFFKADRQYGDYTIANYTTDALSAATFDEAYQAMTSFLGHEGSPIGVRPMYLLHGPKLRNKAFEILRDDFAARTADRTSGTAANESATQGRNPNAGTVIPVQSAHLVDGVKVNGTTYDAADYWFLFGEAAGIPGLVYQNRLAAELQTQKWNPDSEYTFDTDKFQIGARLRGAAFLALPHCIIGNFAA